MDYDLIATPPTLAEYLALRAKSGLSPRTEAQGRGAIAHSWTFCHVRHGGQAVAMGRALGDGGWYFHLADIATDPEHQRRGLGTRVLRWLIAEIEAHAPADPFISLIADPPGQPLYRALGFVETVSKSMVLRR